MKSIRRCNKGLSIPSSPSLSTASSEHGRASRRKSRQRYWKQWRRYQCLWESRVSSASLGRFLEFSLSHVAWENVSRVNSSENDLEEEVLLTKIPPAFRVIRVYFREENIGVRQGAEATICGCIWLKQVTSCLANVCGEIRGACLTAWRIEMKVFDIRTNL